MIDQFGNCDAFHVSSVCCEGSWYPCESCSLDYGGFAKWVDGVVTQCVCLVFWWQMYDFKRKGLNIARCGLDIWKG